MHDVAVESPNRAHRAQDANRHRQQEETGRDEPFGGPFGGLASCSDQMYHLLRVLLIADTAGWKSAAIWRPAEK